MSSTSSEALQWEKLEPYEWWTHDEYYNAVTVTLGELRDNGFIDWDDPSWQWDYYSKEQYERVTKKIDRRFWFREIGILPPGAWKLRFIGLMNELAPKYANLYRAVEGGIDPFQTGNDYGKSRKIFSDFPASQLGGDNQDYASTGTDYEYEDVHQGDVTEQIRKYYENYDDPDMLLLNELDVLFSSLYSVSIGGF